MRTRLATMALVLVTLWGCAQSTQEYGPRPDGPTVGPFTRPQWSYHRPTTRPIEDEHGEELVIIPRPAGQVGGLEFNDAVRMERVRGGELRTRLQDRIVPLPLKHTDVKAQISLNIGSVTLTQQYHNPYAAKIEAVYVFPLPDDAAVRDFVMVIGDRRIRGIIREREEAKQIYLEARRQGHVASLMSQERPNIFTQAVANIEPGKQIDIAITYFHTLRYADRTFEWVFPMVVGPRYNPAGFSGGVGTTANSGQATEVQYLRPGEISLNDIAVEVSINAGMPIEEITSPTHAIRVQGTTVTLSPNDRIPNRDFVLRYKVAGRGVQAGLAVQKEEDGGTFAVMVHPPTALAEVPRSAREMVFVIDVSGSMSGRPLDTARRALVKCLKRLEPSDTFRIYAFSDHVWSMTPDALPANPGNVARGVAWTEALNTSGGTELQEVIRVALDTPAAGERYRIVAFFTDGFIGNDRECVAFARAHLGSARIFSYGIGDSVNRYMLEALARVGRGTCAIVTLDDAGERAADDLFQRIEHPALTDLKIAWDGGAAVDLQPNPLPDVYVGSPVTLIGRYKGKAPLKVRVTGRAGGRPFEAELADDVDNKGAQHAALGAMWARAKITGLYDAMLGSGDPREFVQEIRAIALRHGLLSEYTSFVAVDSLSQTSGQYGTTVAQPVPVPNGVQYETTVERKR